MRIFKYLSLFFIMLFLLPFVVKAEECDVSKITITSMEQHGIKGAAEEKGEPTFKDRNINLNVKMHGVGDSINYDMVIKNDSEEDYVIDENAFKTDSEYIEYTLKTNDGSNVVKGNDSKKVTLIITYKKEVDDSEFGNNNTFDASNNLKLSLNTSEKEKDLDSITTNNIKDQKNPKTKSLNIYLIVMILLVSLVIIYLSYNNINKYNKYLILIISLTFIPVVYAICKCDIDVESTIEIEKKPTLYDTVVGLANDTDACVTKFENEVTDQPGDTKHSDNVYFDNCSGQRNLIFGGYCWQVIRTTDTKGTKVVFNGEPVNGKCPIYRNRHKGITKANIESTNLNAQYLYGSSFSYDITNNTFTLEDTNSATWSDSTYESLIGKYTCKNTSGTCSTIYNINDYVDNDKGYTSSYDISDVNYASIGDSPFNANHMTPSAVGYMFNKSYNIKNKALNEQTYKYGSDVTYDSSTHMYTLSGTVKNIDAHYNKSDVHYTCWDTTGVCSEVSFMYRIDYSKIYYINLKDGKKIDDAINDMFMNDNLNKYNSSIKGIIDAWYKQNLIEYESKIEDTVYCNNRKIKSLGNWRIDKDLDDMFYEIIFAGDYLGDNLTCPNITDSFAVSNNKAKLRYPVALITNEEWENINSIDLRRTGSAYWNLTPRRFGMYNAENRYIYGEGFTSINYSDLVGVNSNGGIRPAISLAYDSLIISGTGSEDDPWIVK